MAGGIGARLYPQSRSKKPKQFTHIFGEGTLIQNTVARLFPLFEPEDIFIIALSSFAQLIKEQLPVIKPENILEEPLMKNTAPCVALAASIIKERYGEEVILVVFPSDHLVNNVGEFQNCLETACAAAEETEGIITLGIYPISPETGFGYIQLKDEILPTPLYEKGLRHISTFAEKPDIETAERFIKSRDFLWNTGIYVWKISTLEQAFASFLPDYYHQFHLLQRHIGKPTCTEMVENLYRQIRSISLDYGIMEKATNVFVIEGDFGWSDVGTWDEVYRLTTKDAQNNVIEGDVVTINSTNCYVSSRDKFIGLVNVEDLVVIDTKDALVICKRGETGDIKELVNAMHRKKILKLL